MNKFENVDIFASLDAIMRQNTGFFQSDFDIDKEIIAKAAASPNREDKTLLWFCRPSGTHCFKERDVFLKDTAAHNTWCFYKEQTCDCVLAYAVELTGRERGKIKGNLYELAALAILIPSVVEKAAIYLFGAYLYNLRPINVVGVMEAIKSNAPYTNFIKNQSAQNLINLSYFNWTYILCSIAISVLVILLLHKTKQKSNKG